MLLALPTSLTNSWITMGQASKQFPFFWWGYIIKFRALRVVEVSILLLRSDFLNHHFSLVGSIIEVKSFRILELGLHAETLHPLGIRQAGAASRICLSVQERLDDWWCPISLLRLTDLVVSIRWVLYHEVADIQLLLLLLWYCRRYCYSFYPSSPAYRCFDILTWWMHNLSWKSTWLSQFWWVETWNSA
jgi:hypothetical protein